jgi:hypothetical protein
MIWPDTSYHIPVSVKNDVNDEINIGGWHPKPMSVGTHII